MEDTEKPKTTPKDFFLWLGAMAALFVSSVSLVHLISTYVEVLFPDAAVVYGDPYSTSIRFAIASLIVVFPLFIWFMRLLHQDIRLHPEKKEVWVRRWLVMLTVFVAGVVMAAEVIMLINAYLEGELSTRFGLKALTVLAVISVVFWYFFQELRGTWERKPGLSIAVGVVSSLVVIVTVVSSFFIIGSPETARLAKLDDQKVLDLQSIQWQLLDFWRRKETLPESLDELKNSFGAYVPPVDTQTGIPYRYERVSADSFKLCATFNAPTWKPKNVDAGVGRSVPATDPMNGSWQHEAGETCFERTVDPEIYPPFKE